MNRLCATFATLSTLPLLVSGARAADIWVDASYTGATSTGSTTQPFKKIGDTYAAIQPGDTVRVRPGNYYEGVWIKSGSSNALRVTYKSEVKWGAKIITPASTNNGGCFQYWGGNTIDNVSTPSVWGMTEANGHKIEPCGWVTIDGFDLHSDKKDSTGAGTWFQWVHHITIRNCWSHDNTMAGLGANLADYIVIENNIVNDNSVGSGLGNDTLFSSGISNWKVRPWDTASGFHNIIRGNVVFNNHNDLTNPNRSDGNGIILDTTAFDKGTLVENNLIVNNGGVGILLDGSANCTVRYNTLYQNCWDGTAPEIYAQKVTWEPGGAQNQENAVCKNAPVYGNIVVARTNRLAVKVNSDSTNSSAHHNLRWFSGQSAPSGVPAFYGNDGNLNDTAGAGDITGQDPQFVNASTNTWASDFHLQHYSAAINKYTVNTANSSDLDGQKRSGTGSFVDYGAYEYRAFVSEPGFEGLASFAAPYSSWVNGGTFYIDTSNARQHTGSRSAGVWVPAGPTRWNAVLQTLTGLSPNTTYTLTAWVWDANATIGPNAYLGVQTTAGTGLGSLTMTPPTGGYGKYTYTFNTGTLSTLVLSVGYNSPANQNSVFRVDDISVNRKTLLP